MGLFAQSSYDRQIRLNDPCAPGDFLRSGRSSQRGATVSCLRARLARACDRCRFSARNFRPGGGVFCTPIGERRRGLVPAQYADYER